MTQNEFLETHGQQVWDLLVRLLQQIECNCLHCQARRNNANSIANQQIALALSCLSMKFDGILSLDEHLKKNSLAFEIQQETERIKVNEAVWPAWAAKTMKEIREAWHSFHGVGKIVVRTVFGGHLNIDIVHVYEGVGNFQFGIERHENYIGMTHVEADRGLAFKSNDGEKVRVLAKLWMATLLAGQGK